MYEVTLSITGIIKKITIPSTDSLQVYSIITEQFGQGKVTIINIRRI